MNNLRITYEGSSEEFSEETGLMVHESEVVCPATDDYSMLTHIYIRPDDVQTFMLESFDKIWNIEILTNEEYYCV